MINYRNLLIRYIKVVGEQEGIDFLGNQPRDCRQWLTDEEWTELKKLSEEANEQVW